MGTWNVADAREKSSCSLNFILIYLNLNNHQYRWKERGNNGTSILSWVGFSGIRDFLSPSTASPCTHRVACTRKSRQMFGAAAAWASGTASRWSHHSTAPGSVHWKVPEPGRMWSLFSWVFFVTLLLSLAYGYLNLNTLRWNKIKNPISPSH